MAEILVEREESVAEGERARPARRRDERGVEDEHGEDGSGLRGCGEGGMIAEAEVPPEPHERAAHAPGSPGFDWAAPPGVSTGASGSTSGSFSRPSSWASAPLSERNRNGWSSSASLAGTTR